MLVALAVAGVAPAGPALAQSAGPNGPGTPELPPSGLTNDAVQGNPPPTPASGTPDAAAVLPAVPSVVKAKPGEEMVERRTADSKTFATDDPDRYVTEIADRPIHYKDAQGRWAPIDPALGAAKDGRRSSKANAFALDVAAKADDSALGRLRLDAGTSVGFSLEGASAVTAKGTDKDMTYTAVKKDTDLRLTSQASGLKEEIVLKSPAAPTTFVFPLSLQGLTATVDERGNVVYRDASGAERARTPKGFMVDSSGDPRSGGEGALSTGVTYRIVAKGKGKALEVTLDKAWLADPARVWPVVVDPTFSAYVPGSSADTYVMTGFHRDNSADADLKVGTYDGGAHVGRAFLKFPGLSALQGKTINSATLKLYENWSWSCSPRPVNVFRVTHDWDGTGLWDWPGAVYSDFVTQSNFAMGYCGGGWASFDVRTAVANWASRAWDNWGLMLAANNEGDNYNWKKFNAFDAGGSSVPVIQVDYTEPPRPPAVPSGVTPVHLSVFGTSTSTVSALYTDPDGGSGYVGFGVWDVNNQLKWSAWSNSVCSGCRATLNVPALPDNWYYVMAIGFDGALTSPWSSPQSYFLDTRTPNPPTNVVPAANAYKASPVVASATYSEPYTFQGRLAFQAFNAGTSTQATPVVWSGYVASGATASATLPALAIGAYDLYAWSYDDRQITGPVGPVRFNVAAAPGAPASIQARGEPASAHVSWGSVTANGAPVSSVTVTARDTASGAVTTKTCTSCVPGSAMVYDGLAPGRSYQFWATPTNAIGAGSPVGPSNTVQAQELSVLTPRIESAAAGDREVVVTWSYLLDLPLVTTFSVQAYVPNQGPLGAPVTVPASLEGDLFRASHRYTGLRNGTPVYFTVSANILGLIQSPASLPSDTVAPAGVPFKPGTPQAQPRDQKAVLTWSAPAAQGDGTPGNNGATIDSYEVAVYTPPAQLVKTVTAPAPVPDTNPVTSFEVGELSNFTDYFFKIRAHNAKGFGDYSDASPTVRPIPAPAAPTDVTAIARDGRAIVGWVSPEPDIVPVTSYRVAAFRENSTIEFSSVTVGLDPTAVSFGGLTNDVSYVFKVVAINESGSSAPSTASSPVTPRAPVTVGQLTTPLAEGRQHTLVLLNDGTVFAWGVNGSGQLGDGTTTGNEPGVIVSGLNQVVSVAAGDDHSLALRADDTVWAWGANGSGQLGAGSGGLSTSPQRVPSLSGVSSIAAGSAHSLALLSDGRVMSWGSNTSSQLGRPGTAAPSVIPGLTNVTSLAASGNYSLAVRSDGSVWGWGANDFGQLGTSPSTVATPTRVGSMNGIASLAAGGSHALALASDGSVWSWGANETGQLGSGDMLPVSGPIRVQSVGSATKITAGVHHSVAIAPDGTAWAWGANDLLQLGNNDTLKRPSAVAVQVLKSNPNTFLSGVFAVAGRGNHTVALTSDGVREWGAHLQIRICVVADPKNTPQPGKQPGPVPVVPPVSPFVGQLGQPEHLFRGGGDSNTNFTPRPTIDTTNFPNNGLSTYDNLRAACQGRSTGNAQLLEYAAVAALTEPVLVPDADPAKSDHYFIRGLTYDRHLQWANTRPGLETGGPVDPFTTAVRNTRIGPVPCALWVGVGL